jgi:hypothetical protein
MQASLQKQIAGTQGEVDHPPDLSAAPLSLTSVVIPELARQRTLLLQNHVE